MYILTLSKWYISGGTTYAASFIALFDTIIILIIAERPGRIHFSLSVEETSVGFGWGKFAFSYRHRNMIIEVIVGGWAQGLTAVEVFFTTFKALSIIFRVIVAKCVIFGSTWSLSHNITNRWINMVVINWTWVWSLLFIIGEITLFA